MFMLCIDTYLTFYYRSAPMSIKISRVIYPHIVKQYESIEQLVSENGYTDFYEARRQELVDFGFDLNDQNRYHEELSEDGFEGTLTMHFDSQEHYDAYLASVSELHEHKFPIYIEETDSHLF